MSVDFDRLVNRSVNAVLGQAVSYDAGGPLQENIQATFTKDDQIVGPDEVISLAPTLFIRQADLPDGVEPAYGHRIMIGTDEYKVHEAQPDGSGAWLLILKDR